MPEVVADAEPDLVAGLDGQRFGLAQHVVVDAADVADEVFGFDVCYGAVAVFGAADVLVGSCVFAVKEDRLVVPWGCVLDGVDIFWMEGVYEQWAREGVASVARATTARMDQRMVSGERYQMRGFGDERAARRGSKTEMMRGFIDGQ